MGTMTLERMLYFAPSIARVCENPTRPILAGNDRGRGKTESVVELGVNWGLTCRIVDLSKASVES